MTYPGAPGKRKAGAAWIDARWVLGSEGKYLAERQNVRRTTKSFAERRSFRQMGDDLAERHNLGDDYDYGCKGLRTGIL